MTLRKRPWLVLIVAGLAALALFQAPKLRNWLAVDSCLDHGGWWVNGACDNRSREAPLVRRNPSTLWPERRVVLGPSNLPRLKGDCWDEASADRLTGSWMPTPRQIEVADSLVGVGLRSPTAQQPLRSAPIGKYARQFIGLLLGADSVIYVNGFDYEWESRPTDVEHDTTYWRHELVCVQGGGAFYFNATIDPSSSSLESLYFNPAM
jgi:hypothetical protein